ncbi:MAG: hypothetical protein ACOC45_03865 [Alkalispirochaetaceae bacterium]
MREFRDLAVVALIALVAVLLVVLVHWMTESAVSAHREMRFQRAVASLSGDTTPGSPERIDTGSLGRRIVLEEGGALYEVIVTGYREELRFLVALDRRGEPTGVALLRDAESPRYDQFLRDPEELLALLQGRREPTELGAGAMVTLNAMSEGVVVAGRHLRGE